MFKGILNLSSFDDILNLTGNSNASIFITHNFKEIFQKNKELCAPKNDSF